MTRKDMDQSRTQKAPAADRAASGTVDAFLKQVAATPARASGGRQGRLLFALDATASREPTWDQATQIQVEMFQEAASLGGIEIQVAYYRGIDEFRASPWVADARTLSRPMSKVRCLAGRTQLERVLRHAVREATEGHVAALVFVGDCMEENPDRVIAAAGDLALRGVPAFVFHEGPDPVASRTFEQIARVTGGACCRFDPSAPEQLRQLLRAVAVFVAGGRKALADYGQRQGGMAGLLTSRLG